MSSTTFRLPLEPLAFVQPMAQSIGFHLTRKRQGLLQWKWSNAQFMKEKFIL
jgi:hypothetical protein